jgi:hypothetical protein
MKYFLFILIAIAAGVFILTQALTRNMGVSPVATNTPTSTVRATSTLPPPLPTQISPTDFRGPIGEPHIIGPSSNPPNY